MPARQLGFHQVDVFSARAFLGNPVAVVHDADDLTTAEMRTIAVWTNLSETTFLLRPTDPGADYRLRIFSLATELPFAGHPTLGTARAWLTAGGTPRNDDRIVQQCEAGLIDLRSTEGRLAFAAPRRTRSGPVEERDLAPILRFLDIDRTAVVDAEWCDNGPGWIAIMLSSSDQVLSLAPPASFPDPVKVGVVAPCAPAADTDFEVRAFFPSPTGIFEDPVTGSLNAGLAQWLFATGRVDGDRYVAAQGTALGRTGRIHVDRDSDGAIWIGGDTRVCLSGTIDV
jgi:PhzF family phenazine biosynthesis protein